MERFWKRENAANTARSYMRNEDGSIFIFGLFTFVIILVLAGIGVDVVRHETLRTELQNTLDRCVLAAANIETTLDPEGVVEDCFDKADLREYLDDVTVVDAGLGKKVTATVSANLDTFFLKFSGIDELGLESDSTAEQGIAELEISMVLDVSGSMSNYSRLTNLDAAGQEFAETVFANAVDDSVAVSVIPYSTQVNAGATILSTLDLADAHSESHCLNFSADDFNTTTLTLGTEDSAGSETYEQTLNFDPWGSADLDEGLDYPVCRTGSSVEILPFSNSLTEVSDKISNLSASGNTSIDVGVKWGTALLDPSTQGVANALIANSEIDGSNAGRPHAYSSTTLKVLVVMTDGVNTTQYRMPDEYRSGPTADIYVDAATNRISMPSTYEECTKKYYYTSKGYLKSYWDCEDHEGFYYPHNGSVQNSAPYGDNPTLMTWDEVWNRMSTIRHAYLRYIAADYNASEYWDWRDDTEVGTGNSTKDARLLAACEAAKDKGILVFTIGFEAPSSAASILQECASSDAHYYDADGIEISEAFAAVATKITELRLVD